MMEYTILDAAQVTTATELECCSQWLRREGLFPRAEVRHLARSGKKAIRKGESLFVLLPEVESVPEGVKRVKAVTTQVLSLSVSVEKDEEKEEELSEEALWEAAKEKFQLGPQLSEDQKQGVLEVLRKNFAAFAKNKMDVGMCTMVVHEIDTGDARPVKQKPYRLSYAEEREAHRQIAELVAAGRVKPCSSPWASPVVMVVKKDKVSLRMCVDMRMLNKVTRPWSYPLPYITDVLERLGGSRYFAVCDILWGFWNVPVREEDKDKTAFVTRGGQWRWEVMPFGLINAPATFQHLMNTIFDRNVHQDYLEIFIDDLCIHGQEWHAFLKSLDTCLGLLIKSGLKLSVEKCKFGFDRVGYLGHVVTPEGTLPDPEKVEAALKLLPPKTVTEVRAFLGLTGYYRRFVRNFSLISRPLNLLTQKGVPFLWTSDQQQAFETLKQQLVSAPILARPDPNKPFVLDTDYQLVAIAAVLSQVGSDGLEHPVAYASRGLNSAERKRPTYEGELLAIVWAVEKFRQYLDNNLGFKLRTDHKPLQYLQTVKNPSRKVAGWLTKLQGFRFTVEHREGVKHSNADGLSRARSLNFPAD
jgi:hypothetical protein